jgi:ActR/RegA family two-component response regulator
MSSANASAPTVAAVLVVSNDKVTIAQVNQSMAKLAMSPEICAEIPTALGLLSNRKFEAVTVDFKLGAHASAIIEKVRLSPSNRTAVIFAISDSDGETAAAYKAGSNFVLRRPLTTDSIDRNMKVAYGLIVRERRRYFRCPVEIPAVISRPDGEIRGKTVNISEGGIAISTAVPLGPGTNVQVEFTLPGHQSRFVVGAAVCWCKDRYLGLQFTSLSPELSSELQEWLARRLEESLPSSVTDKFRNSGNALQ